jgi:adenine-specific DNA-methyltransferase
VGAGAAKTAERRYPGYSMNDTLTVGPAPNPATIGPMLAQALESQTRYQRLSPLNDRKKKGQFFTPPEVCGFMAGLLSLKARTVFRLLDPGAGAGSLAAAFCDRVLDLRSPAKLEIHLFENDPEVLPFLRNTMSGCAEALNRRGHSIAYEIHAKDFILDAAAAAFGAPSLFQDSPELGDFDGIIMNPPYFKLSKASPYAQVMEDVVHGQPNVYAFFLAAGAQLLRPGGEMVAITPRSFCNGLYFRGFRRWFFKRMALDRIHPLRIAHGDVPGRAARKRDHRISPSRQALQHRYS